MIRTLHFHHEDRTFRAEVDDYDDAESSDTVSIYGPGDELLSSYDTCLSRDTAVIAEAKHELGA